MPVKITCRGCGAVLQEHVGLPPEMWYEDLHASLHGSCPKCGRSLPEPYTLRDVVDVKMSIHRGDRT